MKAKHQKQLFNGNKEKDFDIKEEVTPFNSDKAPDPKVRSPVKAR